jgi:integrase
MASHTVKFQSVTIKIYPWIRSNGAEYWRVDYYDADGKRKAIMRSTLANAKKEALKKAIEIAKGTVDFSTLNQSQLTTIRRLLTADPTLKFVDEFLDWKSKSYPEIPFSRAVVEFLAIKETNSGLSTRNVTTLRKHLRPLLTKFPDRSLNSITSAELEKCLGENGSQGNRTRRNIRTSWVTFFRWCRTSEYLPDRITAAERVSSPIVGHTIPQTYTPAELQIMFDAVKPQFLPWLAIAALAGCRTDEICPVAGSRKSPLDWLDFKWDRGIIIIRPETAKTKRRRVVPICESLSKTLQAYRHSTGPVHTAPPPTKIERHMISETKRLGALIGGWKPNALRHSFISYRAALVGLAKTAMEAGNSEAEARASYNDAKGEDEAREWFKCLANVSQPDVSA